MPYKDPEAQREAKRRHYQQNKDAYRARTIKRRERDPSVRDAEYAARRDLTVEEYRDWRDNRVERAAEDRKARAAARQSTRRKRQSEKPPRRASSTRGRDRRDEELHAEAEEITRKQRQMKAEALQRLGLA